MKKELSKSTKLKLIIAFFMIFIFLSGIFAFFEARLYYQRRENNLYLASNQARLIEGSMSTVMARVYTLSALVKSNNGETDFFVTAAKDIYDETAEETGMYVKNFALAPNGVVEYVYPLAGNEDLVGLDYMDATQSGNAAAIEAFEKGKLVLTNPFELKQGGQGIAGRLPVFVSPENAGIAGRLPVYIDESGEKVFWGMVAVTLDMEHLLKQFNLDYLRDTGTAYCLSYMSETGDKVVIAENGNTSRNPIAYEFNPGNLKWTLEVKPAKGWIRPIEIMAGFLGICIISLLIFRVLESRAHIRTINLALEEIAIKDNLTGCYSRHYVNVMLLEQGTKNWKNPADKYSLALVDVDFFKQINDTYGHDVGDRALVMIAETLRDQCDELRGDCVIRYGGDEFIFMMNDVTQELFESRLQAILEQVREIQIPEVPDVKLTVSIGGIVGDGSLNYYDLFSKADEQVYISKENGKDQYHVV